MSRGRFIAVLVVLCMLLIAQPAAAAETPSADTLAKIERYVSDQVKKAGIPGASLAIVADGRVVYAHGFGVADRVTGSPVTPDTAYHIGSVTKTMTAIAIMQLAEQGKVELDAPVQRYLPWWRLADAETSAKVTVRHLLQHTSGFPDNTIGLLWRDYDRINPSAEQGVRELATVAFAAPPGTKFQYANIGYATLGLIVEAVSGRSWTEYMEQNVWGPLGMTHTAAAPGRLPAGVEAAKLHQLIFLSLDEVAPAMTSDWMTAAGSTPVSTANDMARYVLANLGQGPVQLLRPETRQLMQTSGFPLAPSVAETYNLGWFVTSRSGTPLVFHTGGTVGSATLLAMLPEKGMGIMFMTGSMSAASIDIGQQVTAMLLGEEPAATNPDFLKIIAWIYVAMTALALLLLLWLGWAVRRGRWTPRRGVAVTRAVVFALLTVLVVALGLLVVEVMSMPVPAGFYGYPVDFLIAEGTLLLAVLLWTAVSIRQVFKAA